jgi:NAD(P)-dependent dehydrogenase (short-subunit alcohol dehydrogenase family)
MQDTTAVVRSRTLERRQSCRAMLRGRRQARHDERDAACCAVVPPIATTTTSLSSSSTSLLPPRQDAPPSSRRLRSVATALAISALAGSALETPAPAPPPTHGLFDLAGKVAVVTGGTGVLGSVMCRGLAAHGAKVAVLGRRADVAQQVADEIVAAGGEAMALPGDVTDAASLTDARARLEEAWGPRVDILVNAAGGNQQGATVGVDASFSESFNMESFAQVTKLNMVGIILPSKIFGSLMERQKSGTIVNISSMAASQTITRVCGYSAAKAAIENFTKWLAVELAIKKGDKLRVNAIAPGFFIAEQNRELLTNDDGSLTERGESIITNTPFRRFGKAEELVGPLIMLCSDAGSFITGEVVSVDGGFSSYSGV